MKYMVNDHLLHKHEGNKINLIDFPWIPIVGKGEASLREIFTSPNFSQLGGTPTQKIAVLRLLLAIAQAAYTPKNNDEWSNYSLDDLGKNAIEYLEKWYDSFYLYGDKPFLQMLAIKKANIQPFGAVQPQIATGNTTILTQMQCETVLSEAEKALLLLELQCFALGGKKTDNSVVLSSGYQGKSKPNGKATTGRPGSSLGFMGFLHSFYLGKTLLETIHMNLFTYADLDKLIYFSSGLGIPPWEKMPEGEDDEIARQLKSSLIGRLIPLSRFCLLADEGLHYSEGIAHFGYKDSQMVDPSVAIDRSGKETKVLWVDPERRPWRFLTALLSFLHNETFNCAQLSLPAQRIKKKYSQIGIWSGGLRVSSNAGEQYVSGSDDFVDSSVWLLTSDLSKTWFIHWQQAMLKLEQYAKSVYASVYGFYSEQKLDGKAQAALAVNRFWQQCENKLDDLIMACEQVTEDETSNDEPLMKQYKIFQHLMYQQYDNSTARQTPRQIEMWAEHRPNNNRKTNKKGV